MSTLLKHKDNPEVLRKAPTDRAPWHAAWMLGVFVALVLALVLLTSDVRGESLWPSARPPARSMFADRKAAGKGDIIAIIVAESAVAQSSQSKRANCESAVQDSVYGDMLSDTISQQLNAGPGLDLGRFLEQQLTPKSPGAGASTHSSPSI